MFNDKPHKTGIISAVTPRFQVTFNRVLGLLTFTMFRVGQVPEYEYSISLQECQERLEVLDVIREWCDRDSTGKEDK